jgi:hypothetical protein
LAEEGRGVETATRRKRSARSDGEDSSERTFVENQLDGQVEEKERERDEKEKESNNNTEASLERRLRRIERTVHRGSSAPCARRTNPAGAEEGENSQYGGESGVEEEGGEGEKRQSVSSNFVPAKGRSSAVDVEQQLAAFLSAEATSRYRYMLLQGRVRWKKRQKTVGNDEGKGRKQRWLLQSGTLTTRRRLSRGRA